MIAPATELMPLPAAGRRYVAASSVRMGDVDPLGRLRLDAVARHLQDVATDDVADSGFTAPSHQTSDAGRATGWVVRRSLVDVRRAPVLGEGLALTTFCSGTGRCWAERRTSVVGDDGGSIEAVSVWVQVDAATGRPTALADRFHEIYGQAASGRTVSTRLLLGPPPADADARAWAVRAADLDVFGHVNNASHWAILEEVITDRRGVAELEYLAPVDLGMSVLHVAAEPAPGRLEAWLVVDGAVRSAARFVPASHGSPVDR